MTNKWPMTNVQGGNAVWTLVIGPLLAIEAWELLIPSLLLPNLALKITQRGFELFFDF